MKILDASSKKEFVKKRPVMFEGMVCSTDREVIITCALVVFQGQAFKEMLWRSAEEGHNAMRDMRYMEFINRIHVIMKEVKEKYK